MAMKIIKIQGNMVKKNNFILKIEIKGKTSNKDMNAMGMEESKEIIGIKTMTENIIIKIE
jgi:hypothetical protein